jgi:hypothetical protein
MDLENAQTTTELMVPAIISNRGSNDAALSRLERRIHETQHPASAPSAI